MNSETLALIRDRFSVLPPPVQTYVGDTSWASEVRTITASNNLDPDQTEAVVLEFILVLIGLSHINDFEAEIRERLSLVPQNAEMLAREVVAVIPQTIQQLLNDLCVRELSVDQKQPSIGKTLLVPPPAPAPQAPAQPASVFEEKLKRVFTVPREESRVASTPTVPVAPKAPTPPAAPRPGSDPYREPLA